MREAAEGFRFAVIGQLLVSPPKGGELQEALRKLAEQTYQHPLVPDKEISLGFSTIERWYYKAKDAADPFSVLERKARADAGQWWAMSDELFSALESQYHAHPRWTVQLHYDNLAALFEQRPESDPLPSYKTVLRCMREKGWLRRREPAQPTEGQRRASDRLQRREVRSYEASHVHGLWHADFHQARVSLLDGSGQWQRPVALAILDDHSRLCCHLQFYLAETAECLVHGLTQAIMKRGLPRVFMTDNGAAMLAEETSQGLARLGIEHKTTLPPIPPIKKASRRSSGRSLKAVCSNCYGRWKTSSSPSSTTRPKPGSSRTTTETLTAKSAQHPCSGCSIILPSVARHPRPTF